MAIRPTDDELEALQTGVPRRDEAQPYQYQGEETRELPEPSPAEKEAIQKAVDKMRGERPSEPEIAAQDRLEFMAHLLGNTPFRKTYTYFGGGLAVTLETISSEVEATLRDLVVGEERLGRGQEGDRKSRYNGYLMLASLREVRTGSGQSETLRMLEGGDTDESDEWVSKQRPERLRLFQLAFRDFRELIAQLLAKADHPDFWPTPS